MPFLVVFSGVYWQESPVFHYTSYAEHVIVFV